MSKSSSYFKCVFLLGCAFVYSNAIAQQLDSIKLWADESYEIGDFQSAKQNYEQVCNHYKSNTNPDSLAKYTGKWLRSKNKFNDKDVLRLAEDFINKYELKVRDKTYIYRIMISKGTYYTNNEDPESCIEYGETIEKYRKEHGINDPVYVSNYFKMMAYNYNFSGEADSSEYYSLKNIEYIKKHFDEGDVEFGYAYYNLANFYSSYDRIELADSFYALCLTNLESNLEPDHSNIAVISYVYSSDLIALGRYDKAKEFCYRAISIFDQKGMDLFKGYAYLNLSKVEAAVDNFSTYKLYLDNAFSIIDSLEGYPSLARTRVFDGYTGYYLDYQGDYEIALNYQRKSLSEKQELYQEANPNIVQSFFNFGNIFRQYEQLDSAYFYIQKAIEEADKLDMAERLEYANIIYEKGNIEYRRNNVLEAIDLYKQGINKYLKKLDKKHRYVLDGYVDLYTCYKDIGNKDSMVHYLHLATDPFFDERFNNAIILTPNLLNACLSRFKLEFGERILPQEIQQLSGNIDALNLSRILNQSMVIDKGDVEAMNDLIDSIYVFGTSKSMDAYQKNSDRKWLEKALYYDYQNKSRSIQTKIDEDKLLSISGLDSAAIEDYKKLRMEARFLDIATSSSADQGFDVDKRKLEFKRNLQEWEDQYRDNLNDGVGLNFEPIELVQHLCKNRDRAVLTFMIKDSMYYCLKTACRQSNLVQLGDVKTVNANVKLFREALLTNSTDGIIGHGNVLYKQLISPLQLESYTELHIIPIGQLNAINFETLVISYNDKKSFKDVTWMINDYEISNGINLPVRKRGKRITSDSLLILAPGFQNDFKAISSSNQIAVSSTPWTQKLAQELGMRQHSLLLSGDQITIEQWNQNNKNKDVLHIGSHVEIDKSNPLNSKILLNSNGYGIPFFDIYTSELNSNLVVLAGCETGLGQEVNTKEFLSIAHAFQYAGAEELIQSIWKIDDESTNVILKDFYSHYDINKNIGLSLRKAKINYIQQASNSFASPYFWGGLVYVGNGLDIENDETSMLWYWVVGSIAILCFIFIIKKVLKG